MSIAMIASVTACGNSTNQAQTEQTQAEQTQTTDTAQSDAQAAATTAAAAETAAKISGTVTAADLLHFCHLHRLQQNHLWMRIRIAQLL